MWLLWCVVTLATLMADPGHSEAGLSSTSFSNELRSGFTRLFQNGVEQPLQSPYILVNPTDFQNAANPLIQQLYQQRPAPFGPQLESTFHKARPRYELQSLSWVIPYYYVPTRYHPPRGGKRSNDVLVVVVKTRSNCTANNGTESSNPTNDDDDDDDDDSDEKMNPNDEVESVNIVAGGTENGKEPSRCVWAILSCCAPANSPIRYTCFDVLGCSSAFWDTNPCVPPIVQAALEQATKFYVPSTSTNSTEAPPTTSPPPSTQAPAASNTITTDLKSTLTGGGSSIAMATTSPVKAKPTSPATTT